MNRFLKRFGLLSLILVAVLGMAQAQDEPIYFTAQLSGDNVVPAVDTMATGQAMAILVDSTLYVGGTYTGLSTPVATQIRGGAHIHMGAEGENGPIVFELTIEGGTSGTFDGRFDLTEEQIDTLQNGQYYVQIHTEQHNPGELRGQLIPVAADMGM
jgi:hypothetical protein